MPETSDAARPVGACIVCGTGDLHPVLDLGRHPLANCFLTPREAEDAGPLPSYPLGVQWCQDCRLLQLTHIVPPQRMFSTYLYVPSASSTWLQHCEALAEDVIAAGGLRQGDLVVEFGSNDGTLLRAFQRRGLRVLGVDPATNLAREATAAGVPTLARFFGQDVAGEIRAEHGPANVVVSTNVLAHVPDPVAVLRGVRHLLAPDGLYVNESPSLHQLVTHNEFDTIYHEHVSYFSLHALRECCRRAGLAVAWASLQAVHGGTLRIMAVPSVSSSPAIQLSPAGQALAGAEGRDGALDLHGLQAFAGRALAIRERLRELVEQSLTAGQRLAAYGATAKGNTLLNFSALTAAHLEFIADRSPLKQGRLAPGSGILVVSPEHLAADPPQILLLLAWNLADEIRRQLSWFGAGGGAFLVPIPEPRLDGEPRRARP